MIHYHKRRYDFEWNFLSTSVPCHPANATNKWKRLQKDFFSCYELCLGWINSERKMSDSMTKWKKLNRRNVNHVWAVSPSVPRVSHTPAHSFASLRNNALNLGALTRLAELHCRATTTKTKSNSTNVFLQSLRCILHSLSLRAHHWSRRIIITIYQSLLIYKLARTSTELNRKLLLLQVLWDGFD